MLHQQIKEEVKKATLEKNPLKLNVIRGLVAAFINELVTKRRKPDEILTDDEALAVIRRAAKQRQDSIKQFTAGGRADLAAAETAELEIIKTYLPAELSEKEITKLVQKKITELGITDKKYIGKLIGALMKELSGRADGKIVKKIAEKLLP